MSLSDLASIAGLISSVAVLISLVYLALQVRQAAENQRSETQSNTTARRVDMLLRLSEPDNAQLLLRASAEPNLSSAHALQYMMIVNATLTNSEEEFFQHRNGMLDDTRFDLQRGVLRGQLAQRGFRIAWRASKPVFHPEFVAFVDEIMQSTPVETIEPGDVWKMLAAQEFGAAKS